MEARLGDRSDRRCRNAQSRPLSLCCDDSPPGSLRRAHDRAALQGQVRAGLLVTNPACRGCPACRRQPARSPGRRTPRNPCRRFPPRTRPRPDWPGGAAARMDLHPVRAPGRPDALFARMAERHLRVWRARSEHRRRAAAGRSPRCRSSATTRSRVSRCSTRTQGRWSSSSTDRGSVGGVGEDRSRAADLPRRHPKRHDESRPARSGCCATSPRSVHRGGHALEGDLRWST